MGSGRQRRRGASQQGLRQREQRHGSSDKGNNNQGTAGRASGCLDGASLCNFSLSFSVGRLGRGAR